MRGAGGRQWGAARETRLCALCWDTREPRWSKTASSCRAVTPDETRRRGGGRRLRKPEDKVGARGPATGPRGAARARGRWGPGQKWGGLAVWEPGTAVQKAWPSAWLSGRACARVATQSCWPPRAAADVTAGEPGRRGKCWPGSRGASGPAGDAALSSSRGARRPACGRGCCPHRELGGRPRRAGRREPSPARPPAPAPWSLPTGPGASSSAERMGKQTSPPFPPPVGCPAGRGRRGGLWRPHLPG